MAEQNNGSSKSEKYNKAVARATGEGETPESNAPTIPTGAMVVKADDATIAAMMADGAMEWAPQVRKLEEGEMIVGILEGHGPPAELEKLNRVTKEVEISHVPTWILVSQDGGLRMSILSTVQLEKKLPPFIGGLVKIVRGKDLPTGNGQRVTDYLVGGPKRTDGVKRTWAVKPVLDAGSTVKELGAGDHVHEGVIDTAKPANQPAHAS